MANPPGSYYNGAGQLVGEGGVPIQGAQPLSTDQGPLIGNTPVSANGTGGYTNPFASGGQFANVADAAQQAQNYQSNAEKSALSMAGAPNQGQGVPWQGITNQDGTLQSQYQATPGSVNSQNLTPQISNLFGSNTQVNQDPLHNLENYASSTSPSPWLSQALSNNTQNTQNAVNTAANTGAGQTAAAQSNLAMTGGLSSGARERTAEAGASNTDASMQNAANTGLSNAGNLNLQEQSQKFGAMEQLPGQEIASTQPATQQAEYLGNTAAQQQAADVGNQQFNVNQNTQAQQYNINNALNQLGAQRQNTQNNYNNQMAAWGAGQAADAQGGGGKK